MKLSMVPSPENCFKSDLKPVRVPNVLISTNLSFKTILKNCRGINFPNDGLPNADTLLKLYWKWCCRALYHRTTKVFMHFCIFEHMQKNKTLWARYFFHQPSWKFFLTLEVIWTKFSGGYSLWSRNPTVLNLPQNAPSILSIEWLILWL